MSNELREELSEKTEEELKELIKNNGYTVEDGVTKLQLIEILLLATHNQLPEDAHKSAP